MTGPPHRVRPLPQPWNRCSLLHSPGWRPLPQALCLLPVDEVIHKTVMRPGLLRWTDRYPTHLYRVLFLFFLAVCSHALSLEMTRPRGCFCDRGPFVRRRFDCCYRIRRRSHRIAPAALSSPSRVCSMDVNGNGSPESHSRCCSVFTVLNSLLPTASILAAPASPSASYTSSVTPWLYLAANH